MAKYLEPTADKQWPSGRIARQTSWKSAWFDLYI